MANTLRQMLYSAVSQAHSVTELVLVHKTKLITVSLPRVSISDDLTSHIIYNWKRLCGPHTWDEVIQSCQPKGEHLSKWLNDHLITNSPAINVDRREANFLNRWTSS